MNIIDFFIIDQKRLHNWMGASLSDLSSEEWHYMPQGKVNNIAVSYILAKLPVYEVSLESKACRFRVTHERAIDAPYYRWLRQYAHHQETSRACAPTLYGLHM